MKNILKALTLGSIISLSSCDDFLDRTSLDTVDEASFYKTSSDLKAAVSGFYNDFPGWSATGIGFNVLPDSNTDMGTAETPSSRLLGNYGIPTAATASVWSWDEVREANWLLSHVDQAIAETDDDQLEIDQYTGEAYFFRAYYYFALMINYGDLPIFREYFLDTDDQYVYAAREPRNKVADFIIEDLDTAINLLKSFPDISEKPRISKEAAQLFKARVALYEGTWERYHAGTDFGVDGSDGSSFLQTAADAAEDLIDGGVFSLHNDYKTLFNQIGLSGNSETILWRDYNDLELGINNVLQTSWPNRCAYTKFAIDSYLCTDGDPISVSNLYVGDKDLSTIETNRDPRLAATIMTPGDLIKIDTDASELYWQNPDFSTANAGNTGYESEKYRDVNIDANLSNFTRETSKIILRYGEALLIFAEAKAELGTITQADLDKSVNLLRTRVNMPGITLGNITTDPDWPNYGYTTTDIIYEIRRERSVELMGEGFRADDLYRWRAHSLFDGDQPRGAYYNDGIVNVELTVDNANLDSEGYLLPYADTGNYNFDETKAYLLAIPSDELLLNPNLTQNPGW